MGNTNSECPWNPASAVEVTPEEYEKEVLRWLEKAGGGSQDFKVTHRTKLRGQGGEYEFDIVVEFVVLGGARIVILVECKRQNRPVERETVLALQSKTQDVGAHKCVVFSTSGFQRGALEYATAHGIATVSFIDGKSTYFTRALGATPEPPPWLNIPRFAGTFMQIEDGNVSCHLVEDNYLTPLVEWLRIQFGNKSKEGKE